jgi:hypothetical protein
VTQPNYIYSYSFFTLLRIELEIRIASESDHDKWDQLVIASKDGSVFHTWGWLNLIKEYANKTLFGIKGTSEFHPLIISDNNEIVGIMPLFSYQFPTLKIGLSPPPGVETLYLGPIMVFPPGLTEHSEQYRREQFVQELVTYCKNELQLNSVNICTVPEYYDPRPFMWEDYVLYPHFTHIFDLDRKEEEVWNSFNSKLRQDIKKSYKKGLQVNIGQSDQYEQILKLREKRVEFQSSYIFLKNIYDKFHTKNLKVFYAEKEGNLLSGLIILCFKQKMFAWIGVPKCVYEGAYPNELLYWEAMKWGIKEGYKELEIMGADGKILNPFKRKFNGIIAEYYELNWKSQYFKTIDAFFQPLAYTKKILKHLQ